MVSFRNEEDISIPPGPIEATSAAAVMGAAVLFQFPPVRLKRIPVTVTWTNKLNFNSPRSD